MFIKLKLTVRITINYKKLYISEKLIEFTISDNIIGGEFMTKVGDLYVCKICGNAVEVVIAGSGRLVCCGQSMEIVEDDE